jgi:23S rRNA pseudouridine2605 synthase
VFSEPQRLHKVLASCGFGSRRAMEELIVAGRITVNRMPAEIGSKVGPGDEVRINGEPVKIRFTEPRPRVLMYHKPAGEIVTRDDPESRTTVFEDLPPIEGGKWIAVGRLDYNTEGLLLFTNSGELANRLMHPRYEVEREYAVRIMGRLTDEQMAQLTTGIELEDGLAKCDKVEDGGGEEEGANHWYHVVLKEGRNREVRRIFEALGAQVSRLIRTRYGRVAMPAAIKRGQTQELDAQAVNGLLAASGLRANAGSQGPRPPHKPGAGKKRAGPHGAQGAHGKGGGGKHGPRPQGPRAHGAPRPHDAMGHDAVGHDAAEHAAMGGEPVERDGNVAPGHKPRHLGGGRHDNRNRDNHDNRGNTLHARPPGQKSGKRPQGQGKFRPKGPPRQGAQGYHHHGDQRQPRLSSHGQPEQPTYAQPQLTMHAQQYGRGANYAGEVDGNTLQRPGKRPPNRQGRQQGAQPPRQKWVGLPKDEDEQS